MPTRQQPPLWIFLGFLAGLAFAYLIPGEPAFSETSGVGNGSDKFAMVTVSTQNLGGQPDGVFLLDFLTGRLYGAALNQQSGTFTQFYARAITADFGLTADVQPKFVICPGHLNLGSKGQAPFPAQGGLFIAELNSGRVNLYAFPYSTNPRGGGTATLAIVDTFQFREQLIK